MSSVRGNAGVFGLTGLAFRMGVKPCGRSKQGRHGAVGAQGICAPVNAERRHKADLASGFATGV